MAIITREKTITLQIPDTFTLDDENLLVNNIREQVETLIMSKARKISEAQELKWKQDTDEFLVANGYDRRYFDSEGKPLGVNI